MEQMFGQQGEEYNIEKKSSATWRWVRRVGLIILGLALAFFVYVGWLAYKGVPAISEDGTVGGFTAEGPARTITNLPVELITREGSPSFGPKDAPLTIVEFGDFECPFTRESFPVIRSIILKNAEDIRYVYRHFPLPSLHANAVPTAEASMCADEQGKFLAYHDRLFQNQDNLDSASLKKYARQAGLNEVEFNRCVEARKYKTFVEKDMADGTALGVRGTPTWFINGRKVEGSIPKDLFEQVVEELIAQNKQP